MSVEDQPEQPVPSESPEPQPDPPVDDALREEIRQTLAAHGVTPTDDRQVAAAYQYYARRARRRRQLEKDAASPRELVLAWCIWLLGSWGVTLSIDSAVPAVRWMVYSSLIGLMMMWPAYRLSQGCVKKKRGDDADDDSPQGATSLITPSVILRDWFCLMMVFQAVVWPLRITARWEIQQTLWLDGAIAGWSLLAAALTAMGCRSCRAGHRTIAMLCCLMLLLGEPLVMWLWNVVVHPGVDDGVIWTMRVSPIQAIWGLTDIPSSWSMHPWASSVFTVLAAATVVWMMMVLLFHNATKRSTSS